MKANETPEKIYITPNIDRKWQIEAIDDESVEYCRADAFIEKAVGRLKHYLDNGVWVANDVGVREKEVIVEDFVNYMKGE